VKEFPADLAEELGSLLAVIVVEVGMGAWQEGQRVRSGARGEPAGILLGIMVFYASSRRRPADPANHRTLQAFLHVLGLRKGS